LPFLRARELCRKRRRCQMLFGFWEERRLCEGSVKPVFGFGFAAWTMERRGVIVRTARRIIEGEHSAPRAVVVRNIWAGRKSV